jgi:hypothetical protein
MFKGLTKIWAVLGVLVLLTITTAWAFQADPVTFNVRIENVGDFKFNSSGVFNTPVGASGPGPLVPGGAYEVSFNAGPGDRLSFASMFVQSNDWFIAPNQAGLALFNNDGTPITGDVTSQIRLWDSGTEINQEPGLGPDQAPQQASPNTGAVDPTNTVRLVRSEFDNVPAVRDLVRVTLNSPVANEFVLRIENISSEGVLITSDGQAHSTPFAPGVWVVHRSAGPLFTPGVPDLGQGLEALAEDGDPSTLAANLTDQSGLVTPFAPGVWAVHTTANPLFTAGRPDRGQGLEALAEDGDPSTLGKTLADQERVTSSGVFNTPVGAAEPGALLPGHAYEFSIEAAPGDYLSFATMFVQSNDLFYGSAGRGIALFGADGAPIRGDVTDQVLLWDTGTEVNQAPGFGTHQAPRQAGPDSGVDEEGLVQVVNDGFSYPATASTIRVTITVQ